MATVFRPPYAVRIQVRSRIAAIEAQEAVNRLALISAPVAAPFYQTEHPNPTLRPLAQRGHTNPFPLNLYGQDQFFGSPGMGPDYDFPNPQNRRVRQPDMPGSFLALTTVAATTAPVVPVILANPQPPPRTHVGFSYSILPLLYGQDVFFGVAGAPQFDWPNPGRKPTRSVEQVPRSPVLDIIQPPPFFGQADPNPTRQKRALQPELRPTQLPATFATPSVQTSTALPVRQKRYTQDHQRPAWVLYTIVPPPPFSQTEWPNPLRPQFKITLPTGLSAPYIPETVIPPIDCYHEAVAPPLSGLSATAGGLGGLGLTAPLLNGLSATAGGVADLSLTAPSLSGTDVTAEPPC